MKATESICFPTTFSPSHATGSFIWGLYVNNSSSFELLIIFFVFIGRCKIMFSDSTSVLLLFISYTPYEI